MSDTSATSDNLQVLRTQLAGATTPAERVKATLALAEEVWLSDPTAATPLLERVVTEADEAGKTESGLKAASMLSELFRRAGDLDASARYAGLLLNAAHATGDWRDRACGLNLTGLIHQERGELDRALESFEEFLQLSREAGFVKGERSGLNQLAGIHATQGELDKALSCYRQCLESSIKAGDWSAPELLDTFLSGKS
jgi:tetratricopeptide (TPR) repeat protein